MEAIAGKGAEPVGGGAKAVPGYLRPSAGSCHHICKYGGQHAFGEKGHARKAAPPPPAPDGQKVRALVRSRSVSRRRVVGFGKPGKAGTPAAVVAGEKEKEEDEADAVEWKDIVAYDTVPVCELQSPFPEPGKISAHVANLRDSEKKKKKKEKMDVIKGKKSHDKQEQTMIAEEEGVVKKKKNESMNKKLIKSVRSKLTGKASTEPPAESRSASASLQNTSSGGKSVKPPAKGKKIAAASPEVEKKAVDQELAQGDDEAADVKLNEGEAQALHPLDQEHAAGAAESSRPIPVHRRTRSMSISSRSVRLPFVRQASRNSGAGAGAGAAFKLRSKSSKAPATLPSGEEKPARLRFRGGRPAGELESSGGVQLRIRSLRRRVGGGGSASGGFVVPSVALRHQKTLEKKRSQRLYNNLLIEETASRLAKTRKSRVKALVGAFETLISKIGK